MTEELNPEELAAERKESKRFSEHHYGRAQNLAAWLLATLVAVNSGAALALLSFERSLDLDLHKTAAAFVAGVVTAILSGFASWQAAFDQAGEYFVLSKASKGPAEEKNLKLWQTRGKFLEIASRVLNYASLGLFIFGCALAARQLPS